IGDGSQPIVAMAIATPTVQFSSANSTVSERGRFAEITVTRTGGSRGFVTVQFATSTGSASGGSDYGALAQILTFADGETKKKVLIPIHDDRLREGNESVNLVLSSPTGAAVLGTQSAAVLTILDND